MIKIKKSEEPDVFERDYRGRLISEKTPFAVKEAYKMLRTNIRFSARAEKTPIYVVTSAHAKAGKSVTASNVACSFALVGKKVLLIDSDMRVPVICKIFEIEDSEKGLSNLLAGDINIISECIIKTKYDNLDILPSGPIPPNPSELLSNEYIGEIFEELKKLYDIIIVDTPPVQEVTDAVLLSPYATGYIVIAKSGVTKKTNLADTIETIEKNNGKISGIVLNEIMFKSRRTGNKYGKKGYYYHNYYYNTDRKKAADADDADKK